MGSALLVLLVLVVAGLVGWVVVSSGLLARSAAEGRTEERQPRGTTLRYRVPTGQDAAVVLAALTERGYAAQEELVGAQRDIIVSCPGGVDSARSDVRDVIAAAGTSFVDGGEVDREVRFLDETGPEPDRPNG